MGLLCTVEVLEHVSHLIQVLLGTRSRLDESFENHHRHAPGRSRVSEQLQFTVGTIGRPIYI